MKFFREVDPMTKFTNATKAYATTRDSRHPNCWVCAPTNEHGLAVEFQISEVGVVSGEFSCDREFVGYPGYLHGGVISALLDGAMTNCLLALGIPGLTARLDIRFMQPVLLGKTATLHAWLDKTRGYLSILGAELQASVLPLEHCAPHLTACVFQREIHVSGAWLGEIRYFAHDPDVAEAGLKYGSYFQVQTADAPDGSRLVGGRVRRRRRGWSGRNS